MPVNKHQLRGHLLSVLYCKMYICIIFDNFLKNGVITLLYFCIQLLVDDIDHMSRDGFD